MRRRLDPHSGRPLYRQLADVIRDAIAGRDLQPGDSLPTEARLADEYEVGVDAVRDALAVLRGEGLVETLRGKRTRVREIPETTVVSEPPGATITSRMPTPDERQRLGIVEGVPVLVVERDGKVDVLPADRTAIETVGPEDSGA